MTTLGTSLGGAAPAKKKPAKKKGGSKPAPAAGGTALGAPPAQEGGTALGAPAQAPAQAPAPVESGGTALGAPAQGGTALGGTAPAQGGTALGGGVALGGTALGGTALGGGAAAKKKPAKKKPAKKPDAAAPAQDAEATSTPAPQATEAASTPTPTSQEGGAATPAPAQGGTALGGTALGGAAPAGGAAAKKKGKKKKGPAKPAEPAAGGEEAPAAGGEAEKPAAGKKDPKGRKGISKAMAARILQQKEEQKRREEEEARLAEEEARREQERIEEEKRKEEERRLLKIKQKEERKKRKEEQARLEKEKKKAEHLARYGIKVAPKATEGGAPAAKKSQSEMYKNLSKGKGKGKGKSAESSPQPDRAAVASPSPAEDDVEDSWEAHADDEEPTQADSKEKEQVVEEAAQAESEPTGKEEPAKRELRSPICCILGHVDVGKTKLLDKIRHTNVQGGEAGGITQQIGATYFPLETLREKTKQLLEGTKFNIRVPGLLIIDTPGHESFTNLRSRGSSLCDIAILVVDLMHGLEQQTIESIKLLKMRKTPFIVALNKVDRIFSWKATPDAPFVQSLKKQTKSVVQEFETRVMDTIAQFAGQELNAVLYYKNEDFSKYVSLVPTSAHTGEGIPDLLALLVKLTQTKMSAKITTLSTFQATVLEVKIVEGLGTTIDVILSNGVLHEGDRIVICGLDGPIVTTIRALLTPHPLRELRVKTPYLHHKEVKAAQGVKIAAHGMEKAVAGSSLFVVGPGQDEEDLKKHVQGELTDMLSKVSKRGVCVQASTLGSLEALLTFLEASSIPVGAINLGPVHRSDVMRAAVNVGDEKEKGKRKEYGTILAFDVKVTKEARDEAAKHGVKIFTADIIYHLFDQFTAYVEQIKKEEREAAMAKAIFPVSLEILPDCIFNQKEPILVGVRIKGGVLKIGTPLCIAKANEEENANSKKKIIRFIGKVTGIEDNRKPVNEASSGQEVAVKIEGGGVLYGRHFDYNDELFSQLTRESIDVLKVYFRDVLKDPEMIALIKKQKEVLGIL